MNTISVRAKIDFFSKYGKCHFVTFNNLVDNKEHFAIIFKAAEKESCPLVRIHSECITGDSFGSEHCDCGDQLDEALRTFSKVGGILLYLRQEGRGIGLYNKIDSYKLQAKGINTFLANEMLNFPHDMRNFQPAAEMLSALGISHIRLLTNNHDKKKQIELFGIKVKTCINTITYEKERNRQYLLAKLNITGHNLILNEEKYEACVTN